MESDLILMKYLNLGKLTEDDKSILLNLYEKIKNIELPSIYNQLLVRFWTRVEIDKTILEMLGFNEIDINNWLPKVYNALIDEFNVMKKIRSKSKR